MAKETRFIIDMQGQIIWHGSKMVRFKGPQDLWKYLTGAELVPERTQVKPVVDEALVESVDEALKRGVKIQKIGRNSKPDLSGLEPEDLLATLGLV